MMTAAARLLVLLTWLGNVVHTNANGGSEQCERLKLKTPLTYTQDKAPRDLSGVLPVVVEKVNRVLEGVVDVEVEWEGGDLHGKVGDHTVQCKVTRLASAIQEDSLHREDVSTDDEGREVIVQCFLVPFTILDTNECELPSGHSMRHKCHAPSICVNTIGSYECLCPRLDDREKKKTPEATDDEFWAAIAAEQRSPWELSLNSTDLSSCPSSASTHGCCPAFGHSSQGSICRSQFHCPVNPCSTSHDCAPNAKCELADTPRKRPNFICKCPPGLMGNGHACRPGLDAKPEPKVMFDGVTPTEETLKHNYYCGCSTPIIDACAGFPPCKGHNEICSINARNEPECVCKPGFVRDETYGCVDETPPVMKLRHDPDGNHTLRLKQGDVYKEYAVDIMDDNAEEYLRRLRISYSKPLPPGCLTKIGEFHVNYTVATPWTSPPYVRVTRKVVIEDIDECTLDVSKYETSCPEIIPQCDTKAGATCVNTIGSYKCQCPEFTAGDGFKPIHASAVETDLPEGYKGGTGCVDTSLPVINVLGPNPKVFKVCKCGGLKGIMGAPNMGAGGDQLCREQRKRYESSIREMILSTSGAELCATHQKPNPSPSDCVKAIDHTYLGDVDLSSRVVVGEPMQKGPNYWAVSYSVMDDAGNAARTAWRDIRIEEVDLFDVEIKIRAHMEAEKDAEIKEAVKKALEKERASAATVDSVTRPQGNKRNKPAKCPPCPQCKCRGDGSFDPSRCDEYCERKFGSADNTCSESEAPHSPSPLEFLEGILPRRVIVVLSWCVAIILVIYALRLLMTTIFNPSATFSSYNLTPAEEREFQDSVNYYRSPDGSSQVHRNGMPQSAPARAGMSGFGTATNGFGRDAGMYSPPPANRVFYGQDRVDASPFWSPAQSRMTPGSGPRRQNVVFEEEIYADATPRR